MNVDPAMVCPFADRVSSSSCCGSVNLKSQDTVGDSANRSSEQFIINSAAREAEPVPAINIAATNAADAAKLLPGRRLVLRDRINHAMTFPAVCIAKAMSAPSFCV
ncbi:MAG: hypothetical protein RID59_22810 [Hoeflea sp.]